MELSCWFVIIAGATSGGATISGDIVVVGDRGTEYSLGDASVFDLGSATPNNSILELQSSDPIDDEAFGISVSISNNLILVGANQFQAWPVDDGGAAYLFDLNSATPDIPVTVFENPTPQLHDNDDFGTAVAIFDNQIMIGAPGDTSSDNFGAAYVFFSNADEPTVPIAELHHITLPSTSDNFGNAVAISDDYIVVGDRPPGPNPQLVQVYRRDSLDPSTPDFVIPNPSYSWGFGHAIAINGDLIFIGDLGEEVNGWSAAGAVHVYDLTTSDPTVPILTLPNPTPAAQEQFGMAVAAAGNIVAVGCPREGPVSSGAVYIFDLASTTPSEPVRSLINSPISSNDYANYGQALALQDNILVVGATGQLNYDGAALVYDLDSPLPRPPEIRLRNPDTTSFSDEFGESVTISGNKVAVSAIDDGVGGFSAGAVYVFDLEGVDLSMNGVLDHELLIENPAPSSQNDFGISMSLVDNLLAVGSHLDDSLAEDAGAVYVYDLDSITPTIPVQSLFRDDPIEEVFFGSSLAMTPDTLIVGAPEADDRATNSGAVDIYAIQTGGVILNSFDVPSGVIRFGGINDLTLSDDSDLSLARDVAQIQSKIELDIKGVGASQTPTSFEFTVEASVFARGAITQTIELFNYETGSLELVDTRAAGRFDDLVTTISPGGDLSRFIESGTGCVEARVRFRSSENRQRFTANVDQIKWTIE